MQTSRSICIFTNQSFSDPRDSRDPPSGTSLQFPGFPTWPHLILHNFTQHTHAQLNEKFKTQLAQGGLVSAYNIPIHGKVMADVLAIF